MTLAMSALRVRLALRALNPVAIAALLLHLRDATGRVLCPVRHVTSLGACAFITSRWR